LVRFGIRNFKVKPRQAAAGVEKLQGLEGEPLPPNTLAELRRDLKRALPHGLLGQAEDP
jgi:transposase